MRSRFSRIVSAAFLASFVRPALPLLVTLVSFPICSVVPPGRVSFYSGIGDVLCYVSSSVPRVLLQGHLFLFFQLALLRPFDFEFEADAESSQSSLAPSSSLRPAESESESELG